MAFIYGNLSYAKDSNGTTINYNGTNIYQIRLGYQLNSQNIEANTSNITLQLEIRSINSSYKTYGYNQTTTIDGTTLSAKSFDFRSTNTWQIFGTRTFDVTHNADGTYSVEKSGSFTTTATGSGRPHSGNASVTVSLPTIPRASSITVNDANIGSSTNIVINKASSNFTTTLEYSTNNSTWTTIVNKTSNQVYGWTVPTSFYSLIPSAKTLTCYFRATTYSGDTNVGTKTTTATFTATGNPTIPTRTGTDINSITAQLTTGANTSTTRMVKYASNIQISVSATAQNDSYISSIKVNGSNVTLDGSSTSTTRSGTITFNGATTNSFSVVATDSRGYSTTQNISNALTMVDYVSLTINATIKRNQPTDGKVNIIFSGNYFNASFGNQSNTLTVQYRYKESTSSTWGSWTTVNHTKSGNSYTGNTQLSNFDYQKQYDFEIRATDKVGTKPITGIKISKGQPTYWWDSNGLYVNGDLQKNGVSVATGTIPTVNNAWLKIQKNGSNVTTFYANDSTNRTANITIPTALSGFTNDLITAGGNDTNGRYVKFPDGTMITYRKVTITGTSNKSWGSLYYYEDQTERTFGATFTSAPQVYLDHKLNNSNGCWLGHANQPTITTTSITGISLIRTSSASLNVDVYILAIGRWK